MKKIIALVLALALVLASCAVALADYPAAGNGGSKTITVHNAMNGETYTIYQLFDATTDGTNISYTLLEGMNAIPTEVAGIFQLETLTGATTGTTYKAITKIGTPTDDAVQTALKNYVAGSGKTHKIGDILCEDGQVQFTKLKDGYYVIVSTFKGTVNKCIGTSTTSTGVDVYEKNETIPQPDKTVGKKHYSIGDTITYEVRFPGANYIGSGSTAKFVTDYEVSDILPNFLSNVTVVEVSVTSGGTKYTLDPTPQFNNEKKFVIPWADKVGTTWKSKYNNGSEVYIKYTAKLTDVANIGPENTNQVTIRPYYDGQPGNDHWEDEEVIYTYGAALKKVDENGYKLTGAKFKFAGVQATETAPGIYTVVSVNAAEKDETEMTVNSDGMLYIIGLEKEKNLTGQETVAPEGYNKLDGTFTLTAATALSTKVVKTYGWATYDTFGNLIEKHETTFTNATEENQDLSALNPYILSVVNYKGTELPHTGGIGTTIFYILGGLLVVGAAVILVARRKAQD